MQNKNVEKIIEILNNFDFSRVVKTMKALDWTWNDKDLGNYFPSELEMRKLVTDQLTELVKIIESTTRKQREKFYCMACGGFNTIVYFDAENNPQFKVYFSAEEWETY